MDVCPLMSDPFWRDDALRFNRIQHLKARVEAAREAREAKGGGRHGRMGSDEEEGVVSTAVLRSGPIADRPALPPLAHQAAAQAGANANLNGDGPDEAQLQVELSKAFLVAVASLEQAETTLELAEDELRLLEHDGSTNGSTDGSEAAAVSASARRGRDYAGAFGCKIGAVVAHVLGQEDRTAKTVVFATHNDTLDLIALALKRCHVASASFKCTSTDSTKGVISGWVNDPLQQVLLVPLRQAAGAAGLTLTAAQSVIIVDPTSVSAEVEEQAKARVHRLGQTRPVTVLRLFASGTVEEELLTQEPAAPGLAVGHEAGAGVGAGADEATRELLRLFRL